MRIAIPTYGEYISPRFDCAGTLMIIDPGEGETASPVEHNLSEVTDGTRPALLAQMNVTVLLCGGVRRCDLFALEGLGIKVVDGLMGFWRSILNDFLAGRLDGEATRVRRIPCRRYDGQKWRGCRNRHRGGEG